MTNLLKITQPQWRAAEKYFEQNPTAIKMKKPGKDGEGYSFIKIDGELYAINHEVLGEGAFSRVKVVQNKAGDNFKVNIRYFDDKNNDEEELKILRLLNQYQGEGTIHFKPRWISIDNEPTQINQKIYKILSLIEGQSLVEHLYWDDKKNCYYYPDLTKAQRIILAIHCCQALDSLYRNYRIIHRDIKPDNFIVQIDGNHIAATLIDFGFSKILAAGETKYISYGKTGTIGFFAPQIKRCRNVEYSHQSDIYALGVMLKEMGIPDVIANLMMHNNPDMRPSLVDVIYNLFLVLETCPNDELDDTAKQFITDYKQQLAQEEIQPVLLMNRKRLRTPKKAAIDEPTPKRAKVVKPVEPLIFSRPPTPTTEVNENESKEKRRVNPHRKCKKTTFADTGTVQPTLSSMITVVDTPPLISQRRTTRISRYSRAAWKRCDIL